jgi:tRNA nucleotidyltransferase/poly(A) polymerase
MNFLNNQDLKNFVNNLASSGIEVRFVGGCVRDHLLDKQPNDIDLCTPALPKVVQSVCESLGYRTIPTGIEHGTVTVLLNDSLKVEVTTLRIDNDCDGRHANVEFTDSWEHDAERRDFTINAMSMDINGHLYDYFEGKQDLEDGVIRFVGDSNKRIQEDYLRILRFFRFAVNFGFELDQNGINACAKNIEGLKNISGERIQSEMFKLFSTSEYIYEDILFRMEEIGVFKNIDAECFTNLDDICRYNRNYQDSVGVISRIISGSPEKLIERWKLSNFDANKIRYLVKDNTSYYGNLKQLKIDIVNGIPLDYVIQKAINVYCMKDEIEELAIFHFNLPIFPVSGDDLISRFGCKQGKELGLILKALHYIWIEKDFLPSKEDLLKYITD